MSDNEVDVGMTQAMDMIEKLNEEHLEEIGKNVRLEKEIQELKDKRDGITEGKCSECRETKKDKWKSYYLRTSNGISVDDTTAAYLAVSHRLNFCGECRKSLHAHAEIDERTTPTEIREERDLREDMIKWELKWKKMKSPFTRNLVKEWERIMEVKSNLDLFQNGGKGIGGLTWPCCFRGDGGEMRDYVYYGCVAA
jgi:hypothetical protein